MESENRAVKHRGGGFLQPRAFVSIVTSNPLNGLSERSPGLGSEIWICVSVKIHAQGL